MRPEFSTSQGDVPLTILSTLPSYPDAHVRHSEDERVASTASSTVSQAEAYSISSQSTITSPIVQPDAAHSTSMDNHQSLHQTRPNHASTLTSTNPWRLSPSEVSISVSMWSSLPTLRLPKWAARRFDNISRVLSVQVSYGLVTLAVAIFAAATAMYFAYKTFILSRWQAEKDYFDLCMSTTADMPGYRRCQQLLRTELPPPPYPYMPVPDDTSSPKLGRRDGLKSGYHIAAVFFSVSNMVVILSLAVSIAMAWEALLKAGRRRRREHRRLQRSHGESNSHGQYAINVRQPPKRHASSGHQSRPGTSANERARSFIQYRHSQSSGSSSWETNNDHEHLIPRRRLTGTSVIKPNSLNSSQSPGDPVSKSRSISNAELRNSLTASHQASDNHSRPSLASKSSKSFGHTFEHIRRYFGAHASPMSSSSSLLSSSSSSSDIDPAEAKTDRLEAHESSDSDHGEHGEEGLPHIATALVRMGASVAIVPCGSIGKQLAMQLVEGQSDVLHSVISTGTEDAGIRREAQYREQRDEVVMGEQPRHRRVTQLQEHTE